MKLFILILTFLPRLTFGQPTIKEMVDSLKYVTDMPYICETENAYGCGDVIFWRVVKEKQKVIPSLIDILADTTATKAHVPNFGGQWTVGDIAYTAIEEIVKGIPTFELLGVKFDTSGCGYCSYWNHLRKDINNRIKFREAISNWYDLNKAGLVWIKSDLFLTCDCRGNHPNRGHFELQN